MSTGRTNPPKPQHLAATPSPHAAAPRTSESHTASRAPGLTVAIGRALGTVVVTVHGDLNGSTSPQLAEVLRDLIDDQGNLSVVVDTRNLTLSGRDGAAAFVVAAGWARRHGGTLALAHASDALRAALQYDEVHHLVRFTD